MSLPGKTALREWLVVLASLVDDIIIVLVILLVLRLLDVPVTPDIIITLVVLVLVLTLITRRAVLPAIRRRIMAGAEDMLGLSGETLDKLNPTGMVRVKNELWRARAVGEAIEKGARIEVTGIKGLTLLVRRKN